MSLAKLYTPEPKINEKIYASFGRFVINFELVMESMRDFLSCVMYEQGMKNDDIIQAFLTKQHAQELLERTRAVVMIRFKEEEILLKRFAPVWTQFRKVIEQRNRIIHGAWDLPLWNPFANNQGEDDFAYSVMFKTSASGIKLDEVGYSSDELNDEAHRLMICANLFVYLEMIIRDNYNFEEESELSRLIKEFLA